MGDGVAPMINFGIIQEIRYAPTLMNQVAASSTFQNAENIAVDPHHNIYIGDRNGGTIYETTAASGYQTLTPVVAANYPLQIVGGFRYRRIYGKWEPFGEVMAGRSEATGGFRKIGITPGGVLWAFTGVIGGGPDRNISPRWAVRLFDVDYFPATFMNHTDDHENNLKVTAGVVFHFCEQSQFSQRSSQSDGERIRDVERGRKRHVLGGSTWRRGPNQPVSFNASPVAVSWVSRAAPSCA